MRVVGVLVGTGQFKRDFLQNAVHGEQHGLTRALVPTNSAQAKFQILRLSMVSLLSYLLHTPLPVITHEASAAHNALVEWVLRPS